MEENKIDGKECIVQATNGERCEGGLTFEEQQKKIAEAKNLEEKRMIAEAKGGNDFYSHILSIENVRNIRISDDTKKLLTLHAKIFSLNGQIGDICDISQKADSDSAIDAELIDNQMKAYCDYEDKIRDIIFAKMCKTVEETNFKEI